MAVPIVCVGVYKNSTESQMPLVGFIWTVVPNVRKLIVMGVTLIYVSPMGCILLPLVLGRLQKFDHSFIKLHSLRGSNRNLVVLARR